MTRVSGLQPRRRYFPKIAVTFSDAGAEVPTIRGIFRATKQEVKQSLRKLIVSTAAELI